MPSSRPADGAPAPAFGRPVASVAAPRPAPSPRRVRALRPRAACSPRLTAALLADTSGRVAAALFLAVARVRGVAVFFVAADCRTVEAFRTAAVVRVAEAFFAAAGLRAVEAFFAVALRTVPVVPAAATLPAGVFRAATLVREVRLDTGFDVALFAPAIDRAVFSAVVRRPEASRAGVAGRPAAVVFLAPALRAGARAVDVVVFGVPRAAVRAAGPALPAVFAMAVSVHGRVPAPPPAW